MFSKFFWIFILVVLSFAQGVTAEDFAEGEGLVLLLEQMIELLMHIKHDIVPDKGYLLREEAPTEDGTCQNSARSHQTHGRPSKRRWRVIWRSRNLQVRTCWSEDGTRIVQKKLLPSHNMININMLISFYFDGLFYNNYFNHTYFNFYRYIFEFKEQKLTKLKLRLFQIYDWKISAILDISDNLIRKIL